MSLERADVQGLVASGYGQMHEARYLLAKVGEPAAARRWVAGVADRVTTSHRAERARCVNVAFTAPGLSALGVGSAELRSFAIPFQEGMAAPHRQRVLGDDGASAPTRWDWGRIGPEDEVAAVPAAVPADDVHALVALFAPDAEAIAALEEEELARLAAGGAFEVLRRLVPEPLPGRLRTGKFGVEHFGFADGMAQPVVEGTGQEEHLGPAERRRSLVAAGEVVLGYPNGYGELTPWPRLAGPGGEGFGRNGSYLVVRQLSQDVAGFWRALDERTRGPDGSSSPERAVRLAAGMVGRWPSGAPLVTTPDVDDPELGTHDAFGFADEDPYGERCPLGAHIRRANPRDTLVPDRARSLELVNLHRIVRRGRVYGPGLDDVTVDDGVDRGLFFLCLNANIERQFEFIQHTWLHNPRFGGVNTERDPLSSGAGVGSFTVQDVPFRRRVHGLAAFVTVRGGAYFFLPGVTGLRALGALGG